MRKGRAELGHRASGLAALLFAVHPIHVEAVSNVVGRKDVLAAAFLVAMVLAHARARSAAGAARAALAVLLYVAAMASTEIGAVGIALVAMQDLPDAAARSRPERALRLGGGERSTRVVRPRRPRSAVAAERRRGARALVRAGLAALACGALAPRSVRAADEPASWGVQLFVGVVLSFPTPLTIRQDGAPDVSLTARWRTKPFEAPPYYGIGAFRRQGGSEWSLEFVHHKLYLENPPPEVQDFSVSHGYNLVLVGHGREAANGVWVRGGLGVVVAHPESTVRGRTLPEDGGLFGAGYHLAGPAASLGVDGRVRMTDRLRLLLGGRVTGGYAVVPVEGGSARVPNVALHATAGIDGDLLR